MPWLELATYYLIAINFVAFAAFGWDKGRAQQGGWRVRESTLVMLSSIGGIAGALAGRAAFRHKTRKPGFLDRMISGALVPPIVAAALWNLAPAELTQSPEERAQAQQVMASVTYKGCDEVRAFGRAPLHYGNPGYRTHMDGDRDGLACEPYY